MREEIGTTETERHGDVTVVSLLGDHDISNVERAREVLQRAAGSGGGVVVSLVQTEFLDSCVVNLLYRTHAQLRRRGRQLVLHVATASVVQRVLEISGLAAKMECTASLEHALLLAAREHERTEWRTS
jgi:anti-anti-sigma factor